MKKIIINLGKGNLRRGCESVIVQCLDSEQNYFKQFVGSLPPAAELADLHRSWQSLYQAFYQNQAMRINLLRSGEVVRYSNEEFHLICKKLPQKFNEWLNSASFQSLERSLRTNLDPGEIIQVIAIAEDERLRQLPWHLWDFFNDYPQAAVSLSSSEWQETQIASTATAKIRILAIFGNSEGIDLQADREALESLPHKELVLLQEPKLPELNEYLWQEAGWDILFFSGHSETNLEEGRLFLNSEESLTIEQLKHSLKKAIAKGLKIALFNSCDGIGLALKLADLNLPYTVVMGEPVPDRIAQVFLKHFLTAFAGGKIFTLAVREAREKLEGWEGDFFCASWLPLVWQNPAANPVTWQDLQQQLDSEDGANVLSNKDFSTKPNLLNHRFWQQKIWIASLIISSLTMIVRSLGWLQPLELFAYDTLIRQRPLETIDPRILTVTITEEDTNRDRYPLEDRQLVRLIDRLEQHQPAAIGLDIHRAYARGDRYSQLIDRIHSNPNLFTICSYGAKDSSYNPPQDMTQEQLTYQMGFSDLALDRHQIANNTQVRRQILSYDPNLATASSKCITPYSLSFRLAFQYLQQQEVTPIEVNAEQQWQFGQTVFQELTSQFGGYQNLDGKSSQILINYRANQPSQQVTLTELLSRPVDSRLIKDRIVLIGYTASVARDSFQTPYGNMSGVWIHSHMTSQLVSAVLDKRPLIWTLPQWGGIQWGDWLWVLVWSGISSTIIIIVSQRYPKSAIFVAILLIFFLHRVCLSFLIKGGWMPYIPSLLSLLATGGIVLIYSKNPKSYKKL